MANNVSTASEGVLGTTMKQLFSAPLLAAAEAQNELALASVPIVQELAKTTENFQIKLPNGKGLSFAVPAAALVNIPTLSIDELTVDFQMEVTSATTETYKTSSTSEGSLKTSNVEFNTQFSSASNHERSTDQTSKYGVKITMQKAQPAEGLSRILNLFNSMIPNDLTVPTETNSTVTTETDTDTQDNS
eukprot:TRINITY_DN131_c0_g1_i1.p1 TRINITY_DN131_c0_g1~~TRINITY_DN131_c0_g1_i1.p1  ORF type:complete len:189 (-),score=54.21 TRINITY_DN131_c0_g1_i1:53-619(-)